MKSTPCFSDAQLGTTENNLFQMQSFKCLWTHFLFYCYRFFFLFSNLYHPQGLFFCIWYLVRTIKIVKKKNILRKCLHSPTLSYYLLQGHQDWSTFSLSVRGYFNKITFLETLRWYYNIPQPWTGLTVQLPKPRKGSRNHQLAFSFTEHSVSGRCKLFLWWKCQLVLTNTCETSVFLKIANI